MIRATTYKHLFGLTMGLTCLIGFIQAGSVPGAESQSNNLAQLDALYLKVVSDEDQKNMQHIKTIISEDYRDLKSIEAVHAFLDKVRLLDQKHPKNTAFAQADLKELLKFLSSEQLAKLRRVDTDPFQMPITEDKFALAQRAVDEDELTKKLFGNPLRSYIESRKRQMTNHDDGNHRDGNFFSNFWCKVSGTCSNQ